MSYHTRASSQWSSVSVIGLEVFRRLKTPKFFETLLIIKVIKNMIVKKYMKVLIIYHAKILKRLGFQYWRLITGSP